MLSHYFKQKSISLIARNLRDTVVGKSEEQAGTAEVAADRPEVPAADKSTEAQAGDTRIAVDPAGPEADIEQPAAGSTGAAADIAEAGRLHIVVYPGRSRCIRTAAGSEGENRSRKPEARADKTPEERPSGCTLAPDRPAWSRPAARGRHFLDNTG